MNYTTKITERTVFNCFICERETSKAPHEYNNLKDKRVVCSKECDHSKKSIKQREKLESKLKIKSLKVWLNDKYHVERMTTREIAVLMYGRKTHSPNVGAWIKRLGLEVRSGSEAVAMQWENNPKRRARTSEEFKARISMGTEVRRKMIEHMQTEEYRLKCSIVKLGDKNPMWNPDLNEDDRKDRRSLPGNGRWVRQVKVRDNHRCVVCGIHGVKMTSHHLNGYHWDIENRQNVDNGVTLCDSCHKSFHRNYGNRNNTKEQFEEYKQSIINKKYKQLSLI